MAKAEAPSVNKPKRAPVSISAALVNLAKDIESGAILTLSIRLAIELHFRNRARSRIEYSGHFLDAKGLVLCSYKGYPLEVAINNFAPVRTRSFAERSRKHWLLLAACLVIFVVIGSRGGAPQGKLFEKHVQNGRPEVLIYMHGFVDSSFDAYLIQNGSPQLLFSSLPCLKSEFGNSTNKIAHGKPAMRIAGARDHLQMYAIYWSTNGTRFGITWQGYFVAAYDTVSKQQIVIDSNPAVPGEYIPMDALIARFLADSNVTADEVAAAKRRARKKM